MSLPDLKRYPNDRTKPRRRRLVNAMVEGIAAAGVFGISKHDDPARQQYGGLPGHGALRVTGSMGQRGVHKAKEELLDTIEHTQQGWTALLLEDRVLGPAVLLPLPEFLTIVEHLQKGEHP